MPQLLKEEVRERILDAGCRAFAARGYHGATMAEIATAAGVSTGNTYRYFGNKDALFYTLFTDELADELLTTLRRRVRSLVETNDLSSPDPQAAADGEALLRFWIQHRLKVIVLLRGAAGSTFEGFADRFAEELMKPTLAELVRARGGRRLPTTARFCLRRIFDNTIVMLVSILEQYEDEAQIRAAFAAFWSYQLAGLSGFKEWTQS